MRILVLLIVGLMLSNCTNSYVKNKKAELAFYQSNSEGEIINFIQKNISIQDVIIINAGGVLRTWDNKKIFNGGKVIACNNKELFNRVGTILNKKKPSYKQLGF